KEGRSVSCGAACGACCRQIVPLSAVEARHVAAVVAAMPEARQEEVRARFAAVQRAVREAGVLAGVRRDTPDKAVTARYFALGMACPFLVDESCSIYEDRPLICREFVVSSPAENCKNADAHGVRSLHLSAQISR